MAHTEVFLSNDAGVLVPSLPSVAVSKGDTVAFSISGPDAAFAFFSPGAAVVLSPAPTSPVPLSSSSPTVFSFTSSDAGSYSVFFETTETAPVPDFPGGESNLLYCVIDTDGVGFGANVNNTKGGVTPPPSGS
jgi:hypothetical protein